MRWLLFTVKWGEILGGVGYSVEMANESLGRDLVFSLVTTLQLKWPTKPGQNYGKNS